MDEELKDQFEKIEWLIDDSNASRYQINNILSELDILKKLIDEKVK